MKTEDIIKLVTEEKEYDLFENEDFQEQKQKPIFTIKPGSLWFTSWGYDQTNYDFLIILSISPTKKTCECQMVKRNHLGESGQANIQAPNQERYGDVFRMRIQRRIWNDKDDIVLRGSYPYCHTGKMGTGVRLDTFWPVGKREQFYETMPEFGH